MSVGSLRDLIPSSFWFIFVNMPLYLCVDCGGTKAAAVIADQSGTPVARSLGGPSNFAYLGLGPFVSVVKETIEKALKACDPSILKANGTSLRLLNYSSDLTHYRHRPRKPSDPSFPR